MRTIEHQRHINERISYNDCQECRADCERKFLSPQWRYQFVTEYLSWAKPRLLAIKAGEQSSAARHWQRKFVKALHSRITLKGAAETGRKQNDGYLERLRMSLSGRDPNADYLRQFAQRGASTLN